MVNCSTASVAICTHNRASLISRALDSALMQETDPSKLEILIVDNASSDNTWEKVKRYQKQHSNIRYIFEPKLGIAHARNRAISEARGEYLLFLDDDAYASKGWLASHRKAWQEGYEVVVGRVSLVWENKRPHWIPEDFETFFAKYDFGHRDMNLPESAYLITTNASFSLQLLKELGGFNQNLGHKGRLYIGGEDNDLFKRIMASGGRVRYLADALVIHPADADRCTRRWLIKRMFWDGVGAAVLDYQKMPPNIRHIMYDLRTALIYGIKLIFSIFDTPSRWRNIYGAQQHIGRFCARIYLMFSKHG